MKTKILIAALMFFALSVSAFAQASYSVSSTPVTTVASCGATERTGDIIFTQLANALTVLPGTITINYGVPITNTTASGIAVSASDSTGNPATDLTVAVVSTTTNLTAGQLVISVTPSVTTITNSAIRVSGVRVNVSGLPSTTANLTASITSTGNAIESSETTVVVISTLATTIRNFGGSGNSAVTGAVSINGVTGVITSGTNPVSVKLQGNFIGSFASGQTPSQPSKAIIQLIFSAVPAGLSLTLPATVTSDVGGQLFTAVTATGSGATFTVTPVSGVTTVTSASTSFSVFYQASNPTATSLTALDSITVPVTVGLTSSSGQLPLAVGTPVTVSAQMAPLSTTTALSSSNTFSYIPSYGTGQCAINSATIVTVLPAQTVLLIPYAVYELGFDTGIAIANTTTDPGTAAGLTTLAQNGTMTFYFYNQSGTAITSYTTAAGSPGSGLTAAGVLNSGGSYAVLLSQLLAAAGFTGNFQGYVIVVSNFTNAHGEAFVSDFVHFSQGALMLVVPQGSRVAETGLNN